MHLLTREAFATYRKHLAPGGLLLVHISNRYLDMEPVDRRRGARWLVGAVAALHAGCLWACGA